MAVDDDLPRGQPAGRAHHESSGSDSRAEERTLFDVDRRPTSGPTTEEAQHPPQAPEKAEKNDDDPHDAPTKLQVRPDLTSNSDSTGIHTEKTVITSPRMSVVDPQRFEATQLVQRTLDDHTDIDVTAALGDGKMRAPLVVAAVLVVIALVLLGILFADGSQAGT